MQYLSRYSYSLVLPLGGLHEKYQTQHRNWLPTEQFLLYGEKPRNVSIELAGPSGWAVKTEKAYENETEKVAKKYKR